MANDDWLQAIAGALQGVSSVYVPRKQAEFENSLLMLRRQAERQQAAEQYKAKSDIDEASQIRIDRAKPRQEYQTVDYETGLPVGQPTLAHPVPISKNAMDPVAKAAALAQTKNPSQAEYSVAGYAKRIEESNKIFEELAPKVTGMNPTTLGIQRRLPSFAQTTTMQSQEQAERNFINAVLRRESGAVINPSEFVEARKQYFPQPNDSAEVLKQKKDNRETVLNGLIASAGKAYGKINAGTPSKAQLSSPAIGGGKPQRTADDILNKYLGAK